MFRIPEDSRAPRRASASATDEKNGIAREDSRIYQLETKWPDRSTEVQEHE